MRTHFVMPKKCDFNYILLFRKQFYYIKAFKINTRFKKQKNENSVKLKNGGN